MPANYAHYRFGCQIEPSLPANVRRPIQRFRRMYDMGLHGPDIFFYHNIFSDSAVGTQGKKLHTMTGQDFFTMVCRRLRLDPTEAGQAYLYGLLAHYCLDSSCHPLIEEAAADSKTGHLEIETEFDRYLLALDGKESPATWDISAHMNLSRGECVTVAGLYPAITPGNVLQSVKTMSGVTRLLAAPKGKTRSWMHKSANKVVPKFTPFIMTDQPNDTWAHLNDDLKTRYDHAVQRYPILLEQLTAHLTYNAVLGDAFKQTF